MVLNGNCVTVVASTGLHFRAFHLLTSAASHDLKETIILIYCFLQGLRGRFPVNKLNPFFSMPYLPISFLQSFYQKCQVSQYCLGCNREYYE